MSEKPVSEWTEEEFILHKRELKKKMRKINEEPHRSVLDYMFNEDLPSDV